jgi:hypothetical protein
MGNKATGGPFAPLVVVVRGVVGEKEFNKLRGKAISLHSQGGGYSTAGTACTQLPDQGFVSHLQTSSSSIWLDAVQQQLSDLSVPTELLSKSVQLSDPYIILS